MAKPGPMDPPRGGKSGGKRPDALWAPSKGGSPAKAKEMVDGAEGYGGKKESKTARGENDDSGGGVTSTLEGYHAPVARSTPSAVPDCNYYTAEADEMSTPPVTKPGIPGPGGRSND